MKPILLVALSALVACSSGTSDPTPSEATTNSDTTSDNPQGGTSPSTTSGIKYLASNIVFVKTAQAETKAVDTTTKVLASDVVVSKGSSTLSSDNLQTALETEIVPTASSVLQGQWTCKDKSGATTGTASLTDTSFDVATGYCASMGNNVPGVGCKTPLTYTLVENSFLIVNTNGNVEDCGNKKAAATGNITFYLTEKTSKKLVLWAGSNQIFILVK